jgi:hypothetical protein
LTIATYQTAAINTRILSFFLGEAIDPVSNAQGLRPVDLELQRWRSEKTGLKERAVPK